jgi:outer membrane protein OmpA-like peptidoglycan-associated protein
LALGSFLVLPAAGLGASCPGACQTLASSPLALKVSADTAIQVYFGGEPAGQVYSPTNDHGNSGTYIAVDGRLFGPGSFTEQGQAAPTGTGTPDAPLTVVTTLGVGETGLLLTETVRVVNGQPFLRIDRRVENGGPAPKAVSVFHYADLYLRGSDRGFGYFDPPTRSVGGQTPTADFFQAFIPITPAAHFQEGRYSEVFARLAGVAVGGPPLSDAILPPPDPLNIVDNGAALQWDGVVLPRGSRTFSDFWSFGVTPQVPAVPVEPQLDAVAPASGLPGALLTLTGSGFGAQQGTGAVTVRDVPAGIVSWRDDRIELLVPNLAPGPADVAVRSATAVSNPTGIAVLAPPPQAPVPNPVVLPSGGRTVTFDATLSIDPDGRLGRAEAARVPGAGSNTLSVRWDFGDGTTSRKPVVTHTYTRPGDYRASLTVTDASGRSETVGQRVRAAGPAPARRRGRPARRARRATPLPVNISIPSQVVFDFGSSALRPESADFLRRVSRLVRRARVASTVAGYTDSTGPADYNLRLSLERAHSVRRFLIQPGRVRARLLRPIGLGEGRPLASNATEIGRQRNRRVVLTVRLPEGLRRF